MSKFNTVSSGTKTINAAGGQAYIQSPELEFVSILLTSFASGEYYREQNDTFEKIKELIRVCDKKFVAKACVYARTVFGMRSISHVVASQLAKHISGEPWAKDFYTAVIYRPDDMTEILSYHISKKEKIPNSIKKGFAKAFDRFDKYTLAKYRGEGKKFKLIDVVNLVHPIPTVKNDEAIGALVKGELKSFNTWESEMSKAGQDAEAEEFKKEVWTKMVLEKKIGYFALLKNLRNIIQEAPEVIPQAIETLTNENLIKKSLVLPFRYLTAFDEIKKLSPSNEVKLVMTALNKAVDISTNNVPKFEGETLVVLDVSGSMMESGNKSPHIIGSLFASVLVKSNNADFMAFSDIAKYFNINTADSTITIAEALRFSAGGTNFNSIFPLANKKYDRVIILSDMQGWIGAVAPTQTFNAYKTKYGANPFIYSFDLKNYGTMMFPEKNVFCIAGFSEKIFDTMTLMEKDKNALINEIKKIEFKPVLN